MEGCPLAITKNHISLKRIWNCAYYLAHKIQNLSGTAPLQPRKSYICKNFDGKGLKLCICFPQIHILLRMAAPLRLPKIIYFCKFRLKRVWNYAFSSTQNTKIFLGKGAWPLATPAREPAPWTLWTPPRASARSARFARSCLRTGPPQCWKPS